MSPVTLLPSFSFINVVVGFLVAWSPKPFYLSYALALIRFVTNTCPMQVGPSRTLEAVFAIVMRSFRTKDDLALLIFRFPLGASGLWAARQGRERGLAHTLPSFSKPKFCHTTSPALLLVFFFPMDCCASWGKQDFVCGSHFLV